MILMDKEAEKNSDLLDSALDIWRCIWYT
jgi:hypothetical protein